MELSIKMMEKSGSPVKTEPGCLSEAVKHKTAIEPSSKALPVKTVS